MQEKAYKLLALQEKISNAKAKELIDNNQVYANGKKISIARALMSENTKFKIQKLQPVKIIFEDDKILAINKPAGVISESLENKFKARLLNRLDKGTSGVILLCKNEEFRQACINEFKKQRVFKSYIAVLDGILAEEISVNEPILCKKAKGGAICSVHKDGLSAQSLITPLLCSGKKTLAKIIIQTGRTHQIRVHTNYIKHGVIGDEKYAKIAADRMYLHSYEICIFDYKFKAKLDESFSKFDFDIKNLDF